MAKSTQQSGVENNNDKGSRTTSSSSINNYGSRGSGRRHRQKFDPYKWLTSIPPRKTNVLCLGVSYPSVEKQLLKEKISKQLQLFHPQPCVEQAVELVRRNILTEMDGRDLARCFSLESSNSTNAYCVSLESGAAYSPHRHLCANFNRKAFTKECKQAFGASVKFRQIILDYFWIPKGIWAMTHWKPDFFQHTLPSFVKDNVLDTSTICSSLTTTASGDNTNIDSVALLQRGGASGVVYLPFTLHCVSRIIAAYKEISECYTISFMHKSELSEHALWYATSQINPDSMQSWLGKAINQEDTYCTFSLMEVKQTAYKDVTIQDIFDVTSAIQDFSQVRMIRLQALREGETGGFVGLLDNQKKQQQQTPLRGLPTKTAVAQSQSQKCEQLFSVSSSTMSKGRQEEQIIAKFMRVINEFSKDRNAVVTWINEGKGFLIKDKEQFEGVILQQHFNGIKYNTFVRHLQKRGFACKQGKEFCHSFFCRDNVELSTKIDEQFSSQSESKRAKNGIHAACSSDGVNVHNNDIVELSMKLDSQVSFENNVAKDSINVESSSNEKNANKDCSELHVKIDSQFSSFIENNSNIHVESSSNKVTANSDQTVLPMKNDRPLVVLGINNIDNSISIDYGKCTKSPSSGIKRSRQMDGDRRKATVKDFSYSWDDSGSLQNCNTKRCKVAEAEAENCAMEKVATGKWQSDQKVHKASTPTHSLKQQTSCSSATKFKKQEKFTVKLMKHLNATCNDNLTVTTSTSFVSWHQDQNIFYIHDLQLFEQQVLAPHFNGIKYATFEKYLMKRGFVKNIMHPGKACTRGFSHVLFCRDNVELSMKIEEEFMASEKSRRAENKGNSTACKKLSPKMENKIQSAAGDSVLLEAIESNETCKANMKKMGKLKQTADTAAPSPWPTPMVLMQKEDFCASDTIMAHQYSSRNKTSIAIAANRVTPDDIALPSLQKPLTHPLNTHRVDPLELNSSFLPSAHHIKRPSLQQPSTPLSKPSRFHQWEDCYGANKTSHPPPAYGTVLQPSTHMLKVSRFDRYENRFDVNRTFYPPSPHLAASKNLPLLFDQQPYQHKTSAEQADVTRVHFSSLQPSFVPVMHASPVVDLQYSQHVIAAREANAFTTNAPFRESSGTPKVPQIPRVLQHLDLVDFATANAHFHESSDLQNGRHIHCDLQHLDRVDYYHNLERVFDQYCATALASVSSPDFIGRNTSVVNNSCLATADRRFDFVPSAALNDPHTPQLFGTNGLPLNQNILEGLLPKFQSAAAYSLSPEITSIRKGLNNNQPTSRLNSFITPSVSVENFGFKIKSYTE